MSSIVNTEAVFSHKVFPGDKFWPNNKALPVLSYTDVLHFGENAEQEVKQLFEQNGWSNAWTGSIETDRHYHTNTHEVLAVINGDCMLELGGPDGNIQKLKKGDVIVLPAGVVHKSVGNSPDFSVVGAYPQGKEYDMNSEAGANLQEAEEKISQVPLPETDPVFGNEGPLKDLWINHSTGDSTIKKERQF